MKKQSVLRHQTVYVSGFVTIILLLQLTLHSIAAGTYYEDSGQLLGSDTTYDLALGDVDGDDDIDIIAANSGNNRLWLNGGSGFFSLGGSVGQQVSRGAAVALLDGDLFVDVFFANENGDNEVWLGDGLGGFTHLVQTMAPADASQDVALGNLDGNPGVDAFVVANGANSVWINDGDGFFSLGQSLGISRFSHEVVLVDVDNDNDLDAYVANGAAGFLEDELWFNDGTGVFTSTSQLLDGDWNEGAAFGDLDADGDPDLYLATWFGSDAVWINQGGAQGGTVGVFVDSLQPLSSSASTDVTLVDVDQNGSLDAVIANWTGSNAEIWLNDGSGVFTLNSEGLSAAASFEVAAADLDGDNDDDLFFGNFSANEVWFRGGAGLPGAWLNVESRVNPNGNDAYPWALPGDANLPVVLDFGATVPLTITARIEYENSTVTETLTLPPGQTFDNLTVVSPGPNPDELVTVTLNVEPTAAQADRDRVNPLHLVFIAGAQGPLECPLCFVDWLVKLLGFDTSFWTLHHLALTPLRDSGAWPYYQGVMTTYGDEVSAIMMTNPGLMWQSYDTLELWTPALQAYDDGQGDSTFVSQAMADGLVDLLTGIQDEADPALAAQLQLELDALRLEMTVGMSMTEVADRVIQVIEGRRFLPVVSRP